MKSIIFTLDTIKSCEGKEASTLLSLQKKIQSSLTQFIEQTHQLLCKNHPIQIGQEVIA